MIWKECFTENCKTKDKRTDENTDVFYLVTISIYKVQFSNSDTGSDTILIQTYYGVNKTK